jgi:cell division protease FtsH
MTKLDKGEVERVIIKASHISAVLKDKTRIRTYSVEYPELVQVLRDRGVQIEAKPPDESPWYITFLVTWGPFVLFLGLWFFLMRQMQMGGNKALSFGKSRARLLTEERKKVLFSDVAGIDEAKDEVLEIIEFLKDPRKFQKLGGRIPKGVLIVGPPGTGKTLLAKAIAGEAAVPFFSISGSDFVEMFVGVGASRVRDLFEQGKKHAPCIIFIDEIDAVGRLRGAGLGGGHDEREQTLNQLLVEMDGFDTTEGVILVAATNRPDVLDPALLRPGRFDRQVVVNRPDLRGRTEILKVHSKKVPIAADVELEKIARGTPGFSGADLENLVNEAALWAARLNKKEVAFVDFEMAKDKVLMGAERKSLILSDEEKRTTAYHEAGHALIAKLIPGTDPVHKVTIIPRGRALGLTMQLPTDDRHGYSKVYLYNQLAILMGGRVAEELVLNDMTTGAGNDLERATDLARKMVCEWGMSEKMGPLTFGKQNEQVFLGRELGSQRDFSDQIAMEIDEEVKRLVMENYERAKRLLTENMVTLKKLAEALLEKEVLDSSDIDNILMQPTSQAVPA